MGFFSSFLAMELPHEKMGVMAKDYCTGLSVSIKETCLLSKFGLDKERFVPERNALLITIFNLLFILGERQAANIPTATVSLVSLAKVFFQGRVGAYYDSLNESEKLKMQAIRSATYFYANLETSAEHFYLAISGKEFGTLSPDLQVELKEFVNDYVNDVAVFFKKNLPKLLK